MLMKTRSVTFGVAAFFLFIEMLQPLAASLPGSKVNKGTAVSVTRAKKSCFDDITEITGGLVPKAEVLVWPDREGYRITKILVESGMKVEVGQVLAQLAGPEAQQGSGDPAPVKAPVSGTIGKTSAVVGAIASTRAEPLFRIIADGELELSGQILAKSMAGLSAGLPATIKVVGIGELPGRVRFISNMIDSTTQLGEVRVSISLDEQLKPGMFARAIVKSGQRCGRVAIPLSALLYGEEGSVVQVVRDDRVESRIVSTGLRSKRNVEIRQGIQEGDMVVVNAGAFLRDGDRVRPVVADDSIIWK